MKRILSLFLSFALAFSCCACASKDEKAVLDKTELELKIGNSHTFVITESDKELSLDSFEWKSSDENIAIVVSGKVVALKEGSAVITATRKNEILSCKIDVINTAIVEQESPDTTSEPTSSAQTPSTQIPSVPTTITPIITPTVTTPAVCNHQYATRVVEPTCTQEGYTVYTCKNCDKTYNDNYTAASHSYHNYKCLSCCEIDRNNIYNYLAFWIGENGTKREDYYLIEYVDYYDDDIFYYSVSYYYNEDEISCIFYTPREDYDYITYLIIDEISPSYEYGYVCEWLEYELVDEYVSGTINSKNFNDSTQLTYAEFSSDTGMELTQNTLYLIRDGLCLILYTVDDMLQGKCGNTKDSGLTIKDLGFESFQ